MDEDVKKHLLWLLNNAPLEVPGSQLAMVADLHARAVAQVTEGGHGGDHRDV